MTFGIDLVPDAAVAASIRMTPAQWKALSEETRAAIRGLYALASDMAAAHREIAAITIHEKRADWSLNLASLRRAVTVAQKAIRRLSGT